MQNVLIVLGLGALWAAVLVPDLIRRGAATRNRDTVGSFNRHMSTLQRNPAVTTRSPRTPFSPVSPVNDSRGDVPVMTTREAQRRRQDVLSALGAAALLTFLGAISFGGAFTGLHIVVDVALGAYIAALLTVTRRKRVHTETSAYSYPSLGQYDNVARIHSGPAINSAQGYQPAERQHAAR